MSGASPVAADAFQSLFARIRAMFAAHEDACVVLHDEPHRYYLGTHEVRAKDGARTWFGGIEIKKNYLSAHLIPVYAHPEMLDDLDPALRKRMQGKSCFNFKQAGDPSLEPLAAQIDAGAARFAAHGRL